MSELSKINIDGTVYDVKDVVARKKLISVTGATSGQTIKISEVNADGIPVSWEAVDFPTSGENIDLDTTLTQSGQAADAKAVGDALSNAFFGSLDIEDEMLVISDEGSGSGNGGSSVAVSTYKTEDIGELFAAPANYTAWCPGNLRWDKNLGKFVSLIYAAPAHVHTTSELYVTHIDPDSFVVSDPVKCKYVDTDGVTDITPTKGACCSFLILADGTYLMINDFGGSATYKFTSADNGVTWQKVSAVTGYSGAPWNMTELSNGRIIISDDYSKVGFYYSDDGGANWTQVIPATVGGGYEAEACILEVKKGKLIAIGRYSMSGKGYYESGDSESAIFASSEDYGTTWSAWQMSSIDNMNASSCTGIVHDGIVEVFATSRWYSNGSNVNTDNANTGKNGAMIHYMATAENAMKDNFTRVGIVDYAKGAGGEYHSPCAAVDDKGRMLIVHMDGGEKVTCNNRYIRGEIGGLNYKCTEDENSVIKAYSAKHTQALFNSVNEEIAYLRYVLSTMEGSGVEPPSGAWMTLRSWNADDAQPDMFLTSEGSAFSDVAKDNNTVNMSFKQDDGGRYYESQYTSTVRVVPTDGVQDFCLAFTMNGNNSNYSYAVAHRNGKVTALMTGGGGFLLDSNNGNAAIGNSKPTINTNETLELYPGRVVYGGKEYAMVEATPEEFIANVTALHAQYVAAFACAVSGVEAGYASNMDATTSFTEDFVAVNWTAYSAIYDLSYKEKL